MAEAGTSGLVERPGAVVEVVVYKRYVEAVQRMNVANCEPSSGIALTETQRYLSDASAFVRCGNAAVTVLNGTQRIKPPAEGVKVATKRYDVGARCV